jgi:hypothetical protein
MKRLLTDHVSNPCNDNLTINASDEVGSGGAHHLYEISGFDLSTNPSYPESLKAEESTDYVLLLPFQNGPIGEVGVNGITHEVLLAILIDRMRSFQSGQFACRENALALTKLEEALMWLNRRTASRVSRGVEGTHTV